MQSIHYAKEGAKLNVTLNDFEQLVAVDHAEVLDERHAVEAAQMALDIRGPDFLVMADRLRN